jgi:hypothetical protein
MAPEGWVISRFSPFWRSHDRLESAGREHQTRDTEEHVVGGSHPRPTARSLDKWRLISSNAEVVAASLIWGFVINGEGCVSWGCG